MLLGQQPGPFAYRAPCYIRTGRSSYTASLNKIKRGDAKIPAPVQMVFRLIRRDPLIMHAHDKPLKGTPGRPPKNA